MITLITGGARSGKSTFGEQLALEYSRPAYIATAIVTDCEMQDRIDKHKHSRSKAFTTYEQFDEIPALFLHDHDVFLLDCLTIMLTNKVFALCKTPENLSVLEYQYIEDKLMDDVLQIIAKAKAKAKVLIIVSNEVGMSLVPEYPLSRFFRDVLGRANKLVASYANNVYLVVSGIPVKIK